MTGDEMRITQTAGRMATLSFSGLFLSYLIAFVGTILIARMLTPTEFGLASIAFFVPNLVTIVGDFGISTAVTKFVAESAAKRDGEVGHFVNSAIVFDFLLGALMALAGILLAPFISVSILLKPDLVSLAYLASLQAITVTMYNVVYGIGVGLGEARLVGAMTTVQSLAQYGLSITLLVIGLGAKGVVIGYVFGPLASTVMALGLLWRHSPPSTPRWKSLRKMLAFGTPLSGAAVLSAGTSSFYNLMVGRFANAFELGDYAVATRLSFLYNLVVSPVGSAALPAMSQLGIKSESDQLKRAFHYSVKVLVILWVPLGVWLVLLSSQVIRLLFGNAYSGAAPYLILYVLAWLYAGGGEPVLRVLLQSKGQTWYLAKNQLYTLVSGVIVGVVLIPIWGVVGLLVTYLVTFWPAYLLLLRYAERNNAVSLPMSSIVRVYAATLVSSVPIAVIAVAPINYVAQLVLSLLLAIPAYLVALARLRGVDSGDLVLLENSLSGIPYVREVAAPVVRLMRRLMKKSTTSEA